MRVGRPWGADSHLVSVIVCLLAWLAAAKSRLHERKNKSGQKDTPKLAFNKRRWTFQMVNHPKE
jgi:hypothetical protein